MGFLRNLFSYIRTNQPAFKESLKVWLEEELKKIEKAIQSMLDTYNPSYMGSFKMVTTQTASAINTATAVLWDTIDYEYGVYRGTPTSRIYFDNPGFYNLEFSLQVQTTGSSSSSDVTIWVNYLGTPVPYSATRVHVKGNSEADFASWNFTGQAAGGDYIELMWSTTDVSTVLYTEPSTALHPAIPSARITLTQISK